MDDTPRLPVFRAYLATLAFAAENWLDVLRIIAVPVLVATGVTYLLTPQLLRAFMAFPAPGQDADPGAALSALQTVIGVALALCAVGLVTGAMSTAGLLKLLLRGERPRLPVYLAFGREELLILGGQILFVLIMLGVSVAGAILGAILSVAIGALPGAGALTGIAVRVAQLCVMAWIALRLALSNPAAVALGRIGLRPSWTTTSGRVWRLLGYAVLWAVPLLIAQIIVGSALAPPSGDMPSEPPTTDAARFEMMQAYMQRSLAQFDLATATDYARLAFTLLFSAVTTIVLALAPGVVWRMTEPREGTAQPAATDPSAGPWG